MIKNIPIIYPNELFYSFICRTYVRSGVGSSKEFTKLVFAKGTDQPKTAFINKLRNDFKIKLNKQLSDVDILSKHTIFNFYSRFLTKEEKEKAINEIINDKYLFRLAANKSTYKPLAEGIIDKLNTNIIKAE